MRAEGEITSLYLLATLFLMKMEILSDNLNLFLNSLLPRNKYLPGQIKKEGILDLAK